MISRADITSLIDEAEGRFRVCWGTLSRLNGVESAESPKDADLSMALLDFQPTLARALYDLSEMYRRLHQEKLGFIARKADLTPQWFGHRLALIAKYQRAIKATISVGKRLGDSFAWLFYMSSRDHLLKHSDHQRQFHAPPGIGGLGELLFIEGVRMVGGHLVLYHGITTFLRVGDVSYIDVKNRKVAAIGELKTTKVAEGQLNVRLDAVAPSREDMSFLIESTADGDMDDSPQPPPLPKRMKARLDKQVASMGDPFESSDPEGSVELDHDPRIDELDELCKELKISTFAYRKVGDGLLLFGTRTAKRSLSSKLLGSTSPGWTQRLQGIEHEAQRIMNQESGDNEIWLGVLNDPDTEYQLTPGMMPLPLWPLDTGTIEDLLFHNVQIFYLYNPAHLADKLRRAGFEVTSIPGQRGFRVEKRLGENTLGLGGMSYFTRLITHELWDEDAVVETLSSMAKSAEQNDIPPNTKITMDIRQHSGPKPD